MTAAAIEVQGLVKRYGRLTAVDGLSLAVPAGHIYGLVGPDGAGKTSTLRCLAGVLRVDSGGARVAGFDLVRQTEQLREQIGYMPQRFSLYQELTLHENLSFFADLYRVTRADRAERVPRLLGFTRLAGHEQKLAGQLSGGMKQKLALCGVLIHRPPVLLLDEPSTGVDPVSRKEFWEILLELRREGVAILVSTPYMDEAEKCDRIGLMARGRLLVEGTPAELKAGFPYRIVAVAARPLFPARQALSGLPGVRTAVLHGEAVHLVVDDPAVLQAAAPGALSGAGVELLGMQAVAPGLEDVFVHELVARGLTRPGTAAPDQAPGPDQAPAPDRTTRPDRVSGPDPPGGPDAALPPPQRPWAPARRWGERGRKGGGTRAGH